MIDGTRVWCIVPVKRFAVAKSRLTPVLDAQERATLARLMLEDVLDVLMQSKAVLAGVAVVTSDRIAATLARSRGAAAVLDRTDNGINAAVRVAIAQMAEGDGGVIVVPSDIPQVTPGAIAVAAQAIASSGTMAVAAADDGGTNLLACRPAGAIPLHYGPNSFERHSRAATEAGIAVRTLHVPQLLPDIDRPEDLRRFVALESQTRTHEFLSRLGIRERLERCDKRRAAEDFIAAGASS